MIPFNSIFEIQNDEQFAQLALETFRFQSQACGPYRNYLALIGCDISKIECVEQIPFLPIELFKSHDIYCGDRPAEIVFTSSATSGMNPSRHAVRHLVEYEAAFRAAFVQFYGEPKEWSIYGLLPNYLQREGSSLVYMVDRLIAECGSGGFYLDEYEALLRDMEADPKPKILLGVSYALWDLVERYAPKFEGVVVMETGGMKGHREEIPKAVFHKILCDGFGVESIHSEYGMAELLSQGYSKGDGIFNAPPWMKVVIRDINDPFELLGSGVRGGVNIIDLANRYSCAFIQTQDVGRVAEDGSFEIEGRIDHSDIRGCNLLVQ